MHSIFDCQKAGMSQKSAFDTYGELEEITEEPYILDRDADSSESEDDQICKEMAKYNRKLKKSPLIAVFKLHQFSTSNSVRHRFRPVRSITPEEDAQEEMLPEVVNDRTKAAILNSIHFQQLFKGSPVPNNSIHTPNGKQADQRKQNCVEKSSSAQETAIPSNSMIIEELEPIFKASTIAASLIKTSRMRRLSLIPLALPHSQVTPRS
uniref:Uncharacterized protein n=1 Tax=Ditylenchus dipsaci TaxID=166011 RepID=A0A915CLY5_9BILA